MLFINAVYFLLGVSQIQAIRTRDVEEQILAAKEVIYRLLGRNSELFQVNITSSTGNDHFSVYKSDSDTQVSVVGTSGVAVCWGVHFYLKEYCNCHISWDGDRIDLPNPLPSVNITKASLDKWRYYQNVVTYSYSYVWYDWTKWERELDWMALNGINLALAFTGQEAIWQRVYDGLGIRNDFTGPGFLAWLRMGNMRNFARNLTSNWHEYQLDLQHKILNRMRSLGMTPVLPAFSGILPHSFSHYYPSAKTTNITRWNKFSDKLCCPLLLDSTDPMFYLISRTFLREYILEFGTDHFYSVDTFNENTPDSSDVDYLANIARSTYAGIAQVDPKAIWLLQGWMFIHPFWGAEQVKAYVTSVPKGKLLILDLQSDLSPQFSRFESFYGQPFIWCMLHNFGGQLGMYGFLDKINKGVVDGRSYPNSTMVGVGIAPEGINQNYVMYDFMLESPFRNTAQNLTTWIKRYCERRYGPTNTESIELAWQILKRTVYNFDGSFEKLNHKNVDFSGIHISLNTLVKRPSFRLVDLIWYNKSDVLMGAELFLEPIKNKTKQLTELYLHDVVDLLRQSLQITFGSVYEKLIINFRKRSIDNFQVLSQYLFKILDNLDEVLSSNKKFMLGVWLESAKKMAKNINETKNYEYNARNQITLWGPNGEIRDYAAKQWSGLISNYYKPRWQIFVKYLNDSLISNTKINTTILNKEIFMKVEQPFTYSNSSYPTSPNINITDIALSVFESVKDINNFLSQMSNNSKRDASEISLILI